MAATMGTSAAGDHWMRMALRGPQGGRPPVERALTGAASTGNC
jgi:hypothetical protein